MDLKNGTMSDAGIILYFEQLINGIFKILPLKEEDTDTMCDYIESLQREIIGFNSLHEDPKLMKVISTLEYLSKESYSHAICKREVFKCIHILEGIREKYSHEESRGDNE